MSATASYSKHHEPSPAYLPGLDATQGPNARNPGYVPVGYYDQVYGHTYKNDEDGWTYVSHKRKYTSKRRERRIARAAAASN